MEIQRNNITLTDETYAYLGRESEQEIANTFKDNLVKYINIINTFYNTDLNNLSDEEFYNLISSLYDITLDSEDYLKIISKRNNNIYNRFIKIRTFMTFKDIITEGRGRNFSWSNELYQMNYIVAVSEDDDLEDDTILKKEEIKEKLDNKSIVIVSEEPELLDYNLKYREEFIKFPLMNLDYDEFYYDGMYGSIKKDENFHIIISILRNTITNKIIIEDIRDYMNELISQIDEVLSKYNSEYPYNEIAKLCNNWYNSSEEKYTLKKIRHNLNN